MNFNEISITNMKKKANYKTDKNLKKNKGYPAPRATQVQNYNKKEPKKEPNGKKIQN